MKNSVIEKCISGCEIANYSIIKVTPNLKNKELCEILYEELMHNNSFIKELYSYIYNSERRVKLNIFIKSMIMDSITMRKIFHCHDTSYIKMLIKGCDLGINKCNKYLKNLSNNEQQEKETINRIINNEKIFKNKLLKEL